jgi:hypothetical protein
VIEEVLAEEPARFQVRWDDGRTTIVAPKDGTATITRGRRRQAAPAKPAAKRPAAKAKKKPPAKR